MIEHIARRGLQHAHGVLTRSDNSTAPISAFGYTLISTTAFLFMFLTFATVYTLTHLLPTLAIVETPTAAITVSEATEDYGSKGEKDGLVDTVTLVHQKPITSSIRATIRHVVSEGGKLARWRGYLQYLAYVIAVAFVGSFVKTLIPLGGIPAEFIATGITGAVTANLHAAWTHKTIASPHRMSFMEGIPSRKLWKKLALPAAFHAVTPYISMFVLTVLVILLGLNKGMSPAQSNQYTGAQVAWFLARAFFILVMGVACTLFLCIPAHVTLVRIEASLLPEEHDTIVPFDRTFDGKAVSKLLGGTGSVSFLDAWKSFNWEARRRLIKLYVKAFFVIMALMLVFVHVMVFELYIFLGPRLGSAFAEAKHGMML